MQLTAPLTTRWKEFLGHPAKEVPLPWPSPALLAKRLADEGLIQVFSRIARVSGDRLEVTPEHVAEAARAIEVHRTQGWTDAPGRRRKRLRVLWFNSRSSQPRR